MDIQPGAWQGIKNYFRQSWCDGCCQWTLWIYWAVVIIFVGSFGFWGPLLLGDSSISKELLSINTIAPPLAAATCVDLVLNKDERYLKMPAIAIAIIIMGLNYSAFRYESYLAAVASLCLTYIIWWVVNAQNKNLWDNAAPDSGPGGNTDYKKDQVDTLGKKLNMTQEV